MCKVRPRLRMRICNWKKYLMNISFIFLWLNSLICFKLHKLSSLWRKSRRLRTELLGPNVQTVESHALRDRNTIPRPIQMTFAYIGKHLNQANKESASIRSLKNSKTQTTTKITQASTWNLQMAKTRKGERICQRSDLMITWKVSEKRTSNCLWKHQRSTKWQKWLNLRKNEEKKFY